MNESTVKNKQQLKPKEIGIEISIKELAHDKTGELLKEHGSDGTWICMTELKCHRSLCTRRSEMAADKFQLSRWFMRSVTSCPTIQQALVNYEAYTVRGPVED